MPVGNESIDRNIQLFQNVQPFQIQYSNLQNPPVNQNPYPMANVPYSNTGGSSSSTYAMGNVPSRGNTESYMDFFNISN